MPRNGSGVASKPAGTTFVPNTTIESAKVNSVVDDIYALLNDALPIVAGGTGATSASSARTGLGFAADAGNFGKQGANIASASTTDLSTATGDYVFVTGTTTITALGTATAGVERTVVFAAALTLTHNATSLILPGSANITTAAGDSARLKSEGSGNWRCVSYNRASGIPIAEAAPTSGEFLRGYINGLTLSNNATDATNDIDIATGSAGSDGTTPFLMTLASAITKRLDASWAVGTGNGGLDTGSIANGWYYVWLIRRSDTGVVDALFSASSTSPTMPTNYDQKRLIGAFERASAAIRPFTQRGNDFTFTTPIENLNTTTPSTTGSLVIVTAPPVTGVEAKLRILLSEAGTRFGWVRDANQVNDTPTISNADMTTLASSARSGSMKRVFVNSSSQVRYRCDNASVGAFIITTEGFVFPRGGA